MDGNKNMNSLHLYAAMEYRIPLYDVIEAYKKTRLKPSIGSFLSRNHACALSVLYCSENIIKGGYKTPLVSEIYKYIKNRYGVSSSYISGFISGFDNPYILTISDEYSDDYRIGYYNGSKVSDCIFKSKTKGKKMNTPKSVTPKGKLSMNKISTDEFRQIVQVDRNGHPELRKTKTNIKKYGSFYITGFNDALKGKSRTREDFIRDREYNRYIGGLRNGRVVARYI